MTHLVELLREANPGQYGFDKVIVWSGANTLKEIDDYDWLIKVHKPLLDRNLLWRVYWQVFELKRCAITAGCKVVFSPGGLNLSGFDTVVTMSQNMLPFEWNEMRRYGVSMVFCRLLLLRLLQKFSFKKSAGVIFLTDYAKQKVLSVMQGVRVRSEVINHGLNSRFSFAPKKQNEISLYSLDNPFKIIYVSIVDQYKNQWNVVEAVSILRNEGIPVVLELIGPSYSPALKKLNSVIQCLDPMEEWVKYTGNTKYTEIHKKYASADLGVFASSCESFGIILLEYMASGLPVASSDRGPMPEILGEGGSYFSPDCPSDIARSIRDLVLSVDMRLSKSSINYMNSKKFSWKRCADKTFSFLANAV